MTAPSRLERDLGAVAPLLGRTMMVLGGAYLLRALTESGRLPGDRGVALGFAYAVTCFGVADRAAAHKPLSGLFHGLAAVLIGLPLLWEASTRFRLFGPEVSAAALAAMTIAALAVAWHRRIQSLAAAAVAGALLATVFLVAHSGAPVPFTIAMIGLGGATLWLSDAAGWRWIQWPMALSADLLLAGLMGRAVVQPPLDPPGAVVALQLGMVLTYGGVVAVRTLIFGRAVGPFEVVHTAIVLAVALGGALWVTGTSFHNLHLFLGVAAVAGAAGSYLIAFDRIGRQPEVAANFHFYTTLGLVLAFIGVSTIAHGPTVALSFMGAALLLTWTAARIAEPALALHGALFGVAASIGLLRLALAIWTTTGGWRAVTITDVMLIGGLTALVVMPRTMSLSRLVTKVPLPSTAARLILACTFLMTAGGLLLWRLGAWVAGAPIHAGTFASLRTIVLSLASVLVALVGRTAQFREFGWLLYPILGITGIKLLVDDLPHSGASTLFVALGAYGAALILAPKVKR